MFTSRFGKDGYIISVDWSQLEIVLQAYLTQSKKMIQDIASGIDFHIKRLDYACGMGYERLVELCGSDPEWKEKRKQIKGQISFKKGYGATPESVARDSGMDLEFVRDIYRKEDEEYPEISRYYTKLSEQIQKSRYVTRELQGIKDKTTGKLIYRDGEQQGYGTWTSVTGKIYTWKERAVMTKRGDIFRYFLMPEVMNYPIQGLAADFVGMMAGAIKAALDSGLEDTERGLCLMINEVHDSYLFDIHPGVKDKAVKIITDVLKNYKNIFHKSFNLDFNVPLKYEIKEGRSWL
jgi:DNA polymerase I-like protein with 3'-5' exonuclease and polymerase domains